MQRRIVVVALVVAVGTCSGRDDNSARHGAGARQIADRLAAYDRANNVGDLDGLMTIFADDAVLMAPDQPSSVGKAAIKEVIRGWLATECSAAHHPGETESFRDVVIHRGTSLDLSCIGNACSSEVVPRSSTLAISRAFVMPQSERITQGGLDQQQLMARAGCRKKP